MLGGRRIGIPLDADYPPMTEKMRLRCVRLCVRIGGKSERGKLTMMAGRIRDGHDQANRLN